ncbi:MAG: GGDEF domain-containing protein, partial [Proteobacteria bacterium]|nr:GGDEF domain-containing protein [Pseudomonadota bacterium]
MRLTRRVFVDLVVYMIGFGLAIGVVFPFFVLLLGVSSEVALTPSFFAACLGAGVVAGLSNFALARAVVGGRLRILSNVGERMRALASSVRVVDPDAAEVETDGPVLDCSAHDCFVEIDSDDEFGRSADAFIQLVRALGHSLQTEAAVRTFTDLLSSQLALDALATGALDRLLVDTKAEAGALLVEREGKLELASSRGLMEASDLGKNERVREISARGRSELIRSPEGVRVDGVLSSFTPREVLLIPIAYKRA